MKFSWKIGGEAGFGIMTIGLSFSKIATRLGYQIYDYNEYPSLIRGGHNTYEVVVSDQKISAGRWAIDCLVCLNKATFDLDKHRLTPASLVVYDPEEFEPEGNYQKIPVPFKKFKKEWQVQQLMVNTIALGASLALLGGELQFFYDLINQQFGKKGQEVINFNEKLAKVGFDYVQKAFPNQIKPLLIKREASQKLVMVGNDAFSLGAAIADCRFYAAYPMTPSSTVLTTLASWQSQTGMVVRHSEDELAAVNTALWAEFTGVRSAVGTSGGGFALMTEALSFAGIAEIPLVVYLAQRPGPATGMPTWTEQGDLLFAVFAGHGEFPKIILAPGDVEETVILTTKAFDLADIYQTPVIVITDKSLAESHLSLEKSAVQTFISKYKPDYGKIIKRADSLPYLRYQLTPDGISPQLIPGQKGVFYQANSYEHLEDGHTTEDAAARVAQVKKRSQKTVTYLKNHFHAPAVYGDMAQAKAVFVSWGGNKGVIVEAQKILSDQGLATAFIHFTHLFPMDVSQVSALFNSSRRYVLIENNSQAQFGQLLRMQTGIDIKEKILKYDGRPFWPEEIAQYLISQK